jgi:RecA-family ATPase
MKSKLDHALELAALGFYVFPIVAGKKAPPVWKDWQGRATRDRDFIESWWGTSGSPVRNCNIGISTSKFGDGQALLVVDVDNKNGKRGNDELLRLELEGYDLPATAEQRTPTGGRHIIFAVRESVRQGVDILGPGLDVRSRGGYIVGAGSTVRAGGYDINGGRVADAPAWLVDRCGVRPERDGSDARSSQHLAVDADSATARAIHYLTHEAPLAVEGQGGDETTYKVAARLKDLGCTADVAFYLMNVQWNERCSPPWSNDDLYAKVENAYRYGTEPPGIAAPEAVFTQVDPFTEREQTQKGNAPTQNGVPPFNPNDSRIGDIFARPPEKPKFIVQDFYPVACGQENSVGGAGKTTRKLWEKVHIILGKALYGKPILQPGPVLFVTKEDGADIFRYRLYHILRAMDLSPAEQKRVLDNFHVLDLTGDVGARLVAVDQGGNLRATNLAERIYKGYKGEGLAQVTFDPWNAFSPGERFTNDAEAALMMSGALVSRELACNTGFVGHVSKGVAREGIIDAHSGRGGSAMGDNARFVFSYVQHDDKNTEYKPPAEAELAAKRGDLFRLHMTKQSYARRRPEPIWIERNSWRFVVHEGAPATPDDKRAAEGDRVLRFVQAELEKGTKYVQSALVSMHREYDMSRSHAQTMVQWLVSSGGLVKADLPNKERTTSRNHYLLPIFPTVPDIDGGDPFQ